MTGKLANEFPHFACFSSKGGENRFFIDRSVRLLWAMPLKQIGFTSHLIV